MSTEARRASVPPRPGVPPPPAQPPTAPARPPAHGEDRERESALGEDEEWSAFGTAADGSRDPGRPGPAAGPTPPAPRTAPRFPDSRAPSSPQHPDAMTTPPPPPASARFPDTPPPPARPAPGPGHGAGAAPSPGDAPRTPAPSGPWPSRPDGPPRPHGPGVARPARLDSAPAPTAPRPGGQGGSAPAGASGARPAGGSRPAGLHDFRRPGWNASRPTDPDGPRPPGPATPDGTAPAAPATPAAPRRADAGAAPRPADRTGTGPGATAAPDTAPDTASPRPADGTDTGRDSAWTPLPRGWVPTPAGTPRDVGRPPVRTPDGTAPGRRPAPAGDDAVPGRRTVPAPGTGTAPAAGNAPAPRPAVRPATPDPDSRPAWTPTTSHPHPDFAVPPPAPRVPPRPSAAPTRAEAPAAAPAGAPGTGPDPALSWSAPLTPGGAGGVARPVVSFAEPEGFGEPARGTGRRGRAVVAAVCVVLGLGLIGGAVTGSWLVGDSADAVERSTYTAAGGLWHNVPVDSLFPPTVDGQGAGPGGADRTWIRIAVAPDSGCADAFDPLLRKALAPVGCKRLLRATYTDATQSHVTTVGLLFTTADATAMRALDTRFTKEGLATRADLMPRPYAAKGTVAAGFGDRQRASWTVSVLTDAPVVVYAVSGWADGRTVDTPQPAAQATASGATAAPAQAGLGNEAQGLADRVERGLRRTAVTPPSEQPS